jgi:hypothetical protein
MIAALILFVVVGAFVGWQLNRELRNGALRTKFGDRLSRRQHPTYYFVGITMRIALILTCVVGFVIVLGGGLG